MLKPEAAELMTKFASYFPGPPAWDRKQLNQWSGRIEALEHCDVRDGIEALAAQPWRTRPSLGHLLEAASRAREVRTGRQRALPAPELSDDERRRNVAYLESVIARLKRKMDMRGDHAEDQSGKKPREDGTTPSVEDRAAGRLG